MDGWTWRALCLVKYVRERQILYDITYMRNLKKYNKLVNITKKKQSHRHREQTGGYQWEEGRGERHDGVEN